MSEQNNQPLSDDEAKKLARLKAFEDQMGAPIQPQRQRAAEALLGATEGTVARQRKLSFEEQYARQTVYIDRRLVKVIEDLAEQGGRGEKTKIYNFALEAYLSNPENLKEHMSISKWEQRSLVTGEE